MKYENIAAPVAVFLCPIPLCAKGLLMSTIESVVKSYMDARGIKRKTIATRLKLSVWQFNNFVSQDEPSPAARQLIATALGLTLRDFDEMCREFEGAE